MNYFKVLAIICTLFCSSALSADSSKPSKVVLNDGTVLIGQASLEGDTCTVHTANLGTVSVKRSQVKMIAPKDFVMPSQKNDQMASALSQISPGGMGQMKSMLEGDSQMMDSIAGLMDKANIQDALADSGLLSSVQNQDLGALMNNPNFQKVLNDPNVQAIAQQAISKYGHSLGASDDG